MKVPYYLAITSLAALVLGGSIQRSSADPDPYRPVGTLEVNPVSVQTGVKPNLDWSIEYPEVVTDLVDIDDDDSITTKKDLRMDVRVVGAAWSNGIYYFTVNSYLKVYGSWIQLFYGKQHDIDASEIKYSRVLTPGTRVDFSGRGNLGGSNWSSWMMTTYDTPNVQALVNGDSIPDYAPGYDQGDIASFLTQFVDENGSIILGPYDIIYLYKMKPHKMVLLDLQDLVVVVTFTEV